MSEPTPNERAIESLKIAARLATLGLAEESRAASRVAVTLLVRELGLTQKERELVSTLCVHAEARGIVPYHLDKETLAISDIPKCRDCGKRNCACTIQPRRW